MPTLQHRGYTLEVAPAKQVPRTIVVKIVGEGLHDGVDVLTTHEAIPQHEVNLVDAEAAALSTAQRYVDHVLKGQARSVKLPDKELQRYHALVVRKGFEQSDFDVLCHIDDLTPAEGARDAEHVYTIIYRPLHSAWVFRDRGDGSWLHGLEWYINTIRFVRND